MHTIGSSSVYWFDGYQLNRKQCCVVSLVIEVLLVIIGIAMITYQAVNKTDFDIFPGGIIVVVVGVSILFTHLCFLIFKNISENRNFHRQIQLSDTPNVQPTSHFTRNTEQHISPFFVGSSLSYCIDENQDPPIYQYECTHSAINIQIENYVHVPTYVLPSYEEVMASTEQHSQLS